MKRFLFLFILASVLQIQGADTHPQKSDSFNSFQMIRNRPIFDPNRNPRRNNSSRNNDEQPTGNTYVLTGTLLHDNKTLAFFTNVKSDKSQVLSPTQIFANAKILEITPTNLFLENKGGKLSIPVGNQIVLQDDGSIQTSTLSNNSSNTNVSATPSSSATDEISLPSGDAVDIMKRMMERRQKQLSK